MVSDSFIARCLPDRVQPYAYLARLDRPIGTWLLLLPSLWGIVLAAGGLTSLNAGDIEVIALFCIGAIVMRAAGCTINDLWDRDIDAAVARTKTRPLAAGTLTRLQGLVFLAILLALGLTILLQMNTVTILLGVLAMLFVAVYPYMKRVTWWPQAFLGLTFNFGALMGWAAIQGALDLPALLLYAGGFFWTLSYDTIYAHQDKQDDALIGIKSAALRLGERTKPALAVFMAVSWLLLLGAGMMADKGWLFVLVMLAPAAHFVWQWGTLDIDDPATCLRLFKANRYFGGLVLIAMAV
jgi:4-hydroxybenzoate polyprenyltransferase